MITENIFFIRSFNLQRYNYMKLLFDTIQKQKRCIAYKDGYEKLKQSSVEAILNTSKAGVPAVLADAV